MNDIQQELDTNPLGVDIQIIGVNERGHEIGNDDMTDGRDLPWLQDVDADDNDVSDVWYDSWDITYRDVMILDTNNMHVATFNLTQHDLADQNNYDDLKALLISTAEAALTNPWHNADEPLDVDGSSAIVPLDALLIFNELNSVGSYELPTSGVTVDYFYDTNDDGFISPLDALLVLNYLNANSQLGAESEANHAVAARAALDTAESEHDDSSTVLEIAAVDSLMTDGLSGQAIDLELLPNRSQDEPGFDSLQDDDGRALELLEFDDLL